MARQEFELTQPALSPAVTGTGKTLVLDVVAVLLAFVLVSLIVPAGFLLAWAIQHGQNFATLQAMESQELLRIIGVSGILTLLLIQNFVFIALPITRVVWFQKQPWERLGFTARRLPQQIMIGVALGMVVLFMNALLGLLMLQFGLRQNQAEQYPLYAGDYGGQALFLIGAALLVPIGEEVLFRGYLFGALQRLWQQQSWGSMAAYVVSAALFSAAHAMAATEGILALLIPTFVMGLLLAWGVRRTGSVLPAIIAHSMNNGIALMALLSCINGLVPCPTQ